MGDGTIPDLTPVGLNNDNLDNVKTVVSEMTQIVDGKGIEVGADEFEPE